jgi:hypothetical protein
VSEMRWPAILLGSVWIAAEALLDMWPRVDPARGRSMTSWDGLQAMGGLPVTGAVPSVESREGVGGVADPLPASSVDEPTMDPVALWGLIHALRRENASWRAKLRACRADRERLTAQISAGNRHAQEALEQ